MKLIGWCVMVWVRGHYAGRYDYPTERQARAHAEESRRLFRVLGCHYRVRPIWRVAA